MTAPAICTCPTCGSPYTADVPRVDLGRNILIGRTGYTVLEPREAEVLSILIDKYPDAATFDEIIFGIYGYTDEPENARDLMRVYISRLRKCLRPLGWTIPYIRQRWQGYFLQRLEGGDG